MSRWPQLVLAQFCTTDINVVINSEELNENGTPKELLNWSGKCNYQDRSKRVWSTGKVLVEVTGTCLIPGDIAPDIVTIPSGKVTVFDTEREIVIGTKARNPDGTVNYIQLDLK